MSPATFNVYAEIVSPESAEYGEPESRETIGEGLRLRDAIGELFSTRTNQVDGIESIEDCGRWFAVSNGQEFLTGCHESRTMHAAGNITASSYRRLWRLIKGAQS